MYILILIKIFPAGSIYRWFLFDLNIMMVAKQCFFFSCIYQPAFILYWKEKKPPFYFLYLCAYLSLLLTWIPIFPWFKIFYCTSLFWCSNYSKLDQLEFFKAYFLMKFPDLLFFALNFFSGIAECSRFIWYVLWNKPFLWEVFILLSEE